MSQRRRHIVVVMWLLEILSPIFGHEWIQIRSPLTLDEGSEPEPDIAVLSTRLDNFLDTDPTPEDTLLVVEAANTTLRSDLTIKQIMYAQSGIPEYWVVDIPNRLLHVFREPTATGYASAVTLTTDEEVRPLAAPDASVRVADLLP